MMPNLADPHAELDVVGAIEGSDKSSAISFAWDYLRHYEPLFAPYRHQRFTLMEVGIRSGISLKLWEWYFPQAEIVGIDIEPACTAYARPRVHIEIGSQADPAFLRRVCNAHPPTLFIDDGSHLAQHNIVTFETVFPLLQPGGLYIVEDLGLHFGPGAPKWQGPQPRNVIAYFLDLARSCMARQHTSGTETVSPAMPRLVDSVQFIGSAAIVRRRYAQTNVAHATETARAYIEANPPAPVGHLHLATFLAHHKGNTAEARAACQRAIAQGEATLPAFLTLAELSLQQADPVAARAAIGKAADLPTKNLRLLERLAAAQQAIGDPQAAMATLRTLLAVHPQHGRSRARLEALERQ